MSGILICINRSGLSFDASFSKKKRIPLKFYIYFFFEDPEAAVAQEVRPLKRAARGKGRKLKAKKVKTEKSEHCGKCDGLYGEQGIENSWVKCQTCEVWFFGICYPVEVFSLSAITANFTKNQ